MEKEREGLKSFRWGDVIMNDKTNDEPRPLGRGGDQCLCARCILLNSFVVCVQDETY